MHIQNSAIICFDDTRKHKSYCIYNSDKASLIFWNIHLHCLLIVQYLLQENYAEEKRAKSRPYSLLVEAFAVIANIDTIKHTIFFVIHILSKSIFIFSCYHWPAHLSLLSVLAWLSIGPQWATLVCYREFSIWGEWILFPT